MVRPPQRRLLPTITILSPFALKKRVSGRFTASSTVIAGHMPPHARDFLVYVAGGCSVERLQKGRAFFGDEKRSTPGMAYALTRVADRVSACAGLHDRESAAAARYLTELAGGR